MVTEDMKQVDEEEGNSTPRRKEQAVDNTTKALTAELISSLVTRSGLHSPHVLQKEIEKRTKHKGDGCRRIVQFECRLGGYVTTVPTVAGLHSFVNHSTKTDQRIKC